MSTSTRTAPSFASEPLISVVIPAYNREKTIVRAIASVIGQDWPALEVIVVDDGSVDDTVAVVNAVADNRVRLVQCTSNRGAAGARNKGIAAARGAYIALLDSDDEFLPGKLRCQVSALASAPTGCDVSCTGFILTLLDEGVTREKRHEPAQDDFTRLYLECSLSPGSTLMARRQAFDAIGPFDESLRRFEDWDWLLRYAATGRILIVDGILSRVNNVRGRLSKHVMMSASRFIAKRRRMFPDFPSDLRRRAECDIWLQVFETARGEGAALPALTGLSRSFACRPVGTLLYLLRRMNARRIARIATTAAPCGAATASETAPHIAIVIHGITAGGAERATVTIANTLIERGWTVSLVVYAGPDSVPFYALDERVRLICLGFRSKPRAWLIRRALFGLQLFRLRRAVQKSGARLVLSIMDLTNIHTLLAMIGAGIPVIAAERNDPAVHRLSSGWDTARRIFYGRAARIMVQTARAASYFPPRLQPAIRVIPNMLSKEFESLWCVRSRPRSRVLVAMGRLEWQKGFDLLLRAFSRISDEFPDWRLHIYGEGRERQSLLALSRELALGEAVRFMGVTVDVPGVLAEAEVFVLSSRFEGFPNVLLEAMACGCAVVSFDCRSGPRELVTDRRDGVLVPEGDIGALAASMRELMAAPALRQSLGKAASETAKQYRRASVMDQWEIVLQGAMK